MCDDPRLRHRWYCGRRDLWVRPTWGAAGQDASVFILYAVLGGLIGGLVTGGSLARLGQVRLRWAPVVALGTAVQVLLFWSPLGSALGPAAAFGYITSNVAVLAAVAANLAIPGLSLLLVGGALNLLAIVANGGYMPASWAALATAGIVPEPGYSNSVASDAAVLGPLTDLFAVPSWVPMANVFSVGDILIGVGVAIAVLATMHRRGPFIARGPMEAEAQAV